MKYREQPYNEPYYTTNHIYKMQPIPRVIFSLGARGTGKTLGWKLRAIYNFLDFGTKTVYIRRYKQEMKKTLSTFISDINLGDNSLKDLDMKLENRKFLIGGKVAIEFMELSQVVKAKSVVYRDYELFIFDEFLTVDRTLNSYGFNEIFMFQEFMSTVLRSYSKEEVNTQFVFLSNALSTTSDYFDMVGFENGIKPNIEYQYPEHSKLILVEIKSTTKEFREKMEKSLINELLPSTSYKRYAIENEFISEDTSNIIPFEKIKGHKNYYFTLIFSDMKIYVYRNGIKVYLHHKLKKSKDIEEKLYTLDKDLVDSNVLYCNNLSPITSYITNAITFNRITYSSMKVKKKILSNLKKIVKTYF